MGITHANKEISKKKIECNGSFTVKLSLTAEPSIQTNPVDIVLILDRSTSMSGTPFANLKNGAKKFIDIIAESTGGAASGQIGFGSHIGIVSFADTAVQDTQLITSVHDLKEAVEALTAGGRTNHADAFAKAAALFDPSSANERVMVMFTDGRTTLGGDATPIAEAAKAAGVIIYCIGLSGNGGIDEDALNAWASEPPSSYVSITPNDEDLEKLFEDLARNLSKPGAEDIVITEKLNPCFKITALSNPTKGTASLTGTTSLEWKIDKLGEKESESAVLEFTVQHVGPCSGTLEVNESVTYSDKEHNHVEFPSPEIEVECDIEICPEGCPRAIPITFDSCQTNLEFNAGDVAIESAGRILQIDVKLKNVCPNKRVALAVALTEVDEHDKEFERGTKTIVVPAHTRTGCQDVTVRCIKFILPESLDVSGGSTTSLCDQRKFKVRIFSHYIDGGFVCCPACSAHTT